MMRFHWLGFDPSRKLSAEEAVELAARMGELTKAGLPLGPGLRALAGELPGHRLPRVLRAMADRLDAGDDLAATIETEGRGLPPSLRGLVLAGIHSGRLSEVLEEYVDLQRSQWELRRRVWLSLAYPLVLLVAMTLMAILCKYLIVNEFKKIFDDFQTELPALTKVIISGAGPFALSLVILAGLLVLVPLMLWLAPHVSWVWLVLNRVPMVGPLLRWRHLSQFSRLMGLLLEQQVSLPDALRLTAAGLRDARLAQGCCGAANDVESGRSLGESLAARRQFPASLIPMIQWGQQSPALAEAFRAAAEMFEGRVRAQGTLLESVLLPIMLLVIVTFTGFFVIAMLLPLVSLITRLSS
jgi:type II secretory pathway component PulF